VYRPVVKEINQSHQKVEMKSIMVKLALKTVSLAIVPAILISVSLQAQSKLPEIFLTDAATLLSARQEYAKGGGEFKQAIDALLRDGSKALKAPYASVMDKPEAPPSGDKHDYMSVAPYWWPDTTKPSGTPYIRRDGEVNPEHDIIGDRIRLGQMMGDVRTLGLAYYLTGDEAYASNAIGRLRVWFLDPATRMNPNLKYAQSIKGVVEGRGIGIIDAHGLRDVVDAMQLLKDSKSWTNEIDRGLRDWFTSYLQWLLESSNGKEESAAKNNHGTTYDVQVSTIALYLGKRDVVKQIALAAGEKRIAVQIEPDGSQPLELERTKSWGYSVMNLDGLVNLALLAKQTGVDLWHFSTNDGRSIKRGIDFLLPFAVDGKKWPYPQIEPMDRNRLYAILKVAVETFGESSYQSACERLYTPAIKASRTFLFLPGDSKKFK
jgi:hypothetical protein